jgi:NADPH:quinone reductase-like Zn-dependent oxidoreductase
VKAVVFTRYGSPNELELRELEKPAPRDNEVLVRVRAVSLNDWDLGALAGRDVVNRLIFGITRPKKQILGSDVAGIVEQVGSNVREFRVGDEVFGDLSGTWGGLAEYVCAREEALVKKSPSITFEQAAAIPQAAMLALQALRDIGQIQPRQKVLINGAGGGVGTFAMQIARMYEAEITAVDSASKLDMLRSMGALHVIDYAKQDFTRNGERYDLVLDVKSTRSVLDCARALTPKGMYVTVGGAMPRLFQGLLLWPWIAMTTSKRVRILALKPNKGLAYMNELFESGAVIPVIDRLYDLTETREAFRSFTTAQHKGKIVVHVS